MPVALHDLGRDGAGWRPELLADVLLDARVDVGIACRPRRRSCPTRSLGARRRRRCRSRRSSAHQIGELQAEGDRLGVDAVGAARPSACRGCSRARRAARPSAASVGRAAGRRAHELEREARCRARRSWSCRSGRSSLPRPTCSATLVRKAMTSCFSRRLDLVDAGDVERGLGLDLGGRRLRGSCRACSRPSRRRPRRPARPATWPRRSRSRPSQGACSARSSVCPPRPPASRLGRLCRPPALSSTAILSHFAAGGVRGAEGTGRGRAGRPAHVSLADGAAVGEIGDERVRFLPPSIGRTRSRLCLPRLHGLAGEHVLGPAESSGPSDARGDTSAWPAGTSCRRRPSTVARAAPDRDHPVGGRRRRCSRVSSCASGSSSPGSRLLTA